MKDIKIYEIEAERGVRVFTTKPDGCSVYSETTIKVLDNDTEINFKRYAVAFGNLNTVMGHGNPYTWVGGVSSPNIVVGREIQTHQVIDFNQFYKFYARTYFCEPYLLRHATEDINCIYIYERLYTMPLDGMVAEDDYTLGLGVVEGFDPMTDFKEKYLYTVMRSEEDCHSYYYQPCVYDFIAPNAECMYLSTEKDKVELDFLKCTSLNKSVMLKTDNVVELNKVYHGLYKSEFLFFREMYRRWSENIGKGVDMTAMEHYSIPLKPYATDAKILIDRKMYTERDILHLMKVIDDSNKKDMTVWEEWLQVRCSEIPDNLHFHSDNHRYVAGYKVDGKWIYSHFDDLTEADSRANSVFLRMRDSNGPCKSGRDEHFEFMGMVDARLRVLLGMESCFVNDFSFYVWDAWNNTIELVYTLPPHWYTVDVKGEKERRFLTSEEVVEYLDTFGVEVDDDPCQWSDRGGDDDDIAMVTVGRTTDIDPEINAEIWYFKKEEGD